MRANSEPCFSLGYPIQQRIRANISYLRNIAIAISSLSFVLLLSACGQTGPLKLPDSPVNQDEPTPIQPEDLSVSNNIYQAPQALTSSPLARSNRSASLQTPAANPLTLPVERP